jgi:hypothetical protein
MLLSVRNLITMNGRHRRQAVAAGDREATLDGGGAASYQRGAARPNTEKVNAAETIRRPAPRAQRSAPPIQRITGRFGIR